jgi:UDP-glucose 4-epimerase
VLIHNNPKSINPSRVVILGAGGFVGSQLVLRLQSEKIPILALSTKDLDLAADDAGEKLLKLLQPNDAVVVLAVEKPNKTMDVDAFLNNIKMAKNICWAVNRIECAQVVYFSSDAVYSFETEVITEKTLAAPTSVYGALHLAREILFRESITKAPLAILRSTQIYGVSANHNAYGPCKMCRSALKDAKIEIFGLGEERRDFIFIDDVVQLTLLVLRHCSAGLLNLATGQSISYKDLSSIIINVIGTPIAILFSERKQEISHRVFEVANVEQAFSKFKFISVRKGIEEFLE